MSQAKMHAQNATAGHLTLQTLALGIEAQEIQTVLVLFTDLYGRLLGKHLEADHFLDHCARHGTHACNYLLTADLDMQPVQGYAFAGWQAGYGDMRLIPDLSTFRRASWLPRTAIALCDVADDEGRLVRIAPRTILREQCGRAAARGLDLLTASELEYYLFGQSYAAAAARDYGDLVPLDPGTQDYKTVRVAAESFNAQARQHLRASGIPVEGSKGEWGPGQCELNVRPADPLEMADRHALVKHCLKETAHARGLSLTFMAKPRTDWAGSGAHLHVSIGRRGSLPQDDHADGDGLAGDERLQHFLAGLIRYAPDFMVCYAPTVNAYKRYQHQSWAPTRLGWARDNRTASFRMVGKGPDLRVECRIPGADCNPYLAYAAVIACGLRGMDESLPLPAPVRGDLYADTSQAPLPASLREATANFCGSAVVAEAFGPDVVEHYTRFFDTEQRAFDSAVTDWERRRYFEQM